MRSLPSRRSVPTVALFALFCAAGTLPFGPVGQAAAESDGEELLQSCRKMFHLQPKGVRTNKFFGIKTLQNPLDVWITQEIMFEVKPDFVVEAGTFHGGSAVLWAVLLEHINPEGRVITIDIRDQREPAAKTLPIVKRRVEFLHGSSTAPEIVAEVTRRVRGKKVLVILDSLHTTEHVLEELKAYAPLVNLGSYLIVQDTPVGPGLAIEQFLATNTDFKVDRRRERLLITNNIGGFLRRIRQ